MKKIMIFLICICQIIIVQAQEWMAMQRPLTEAKKSEVFILIPNTVASSPEFLGLVQEMNNTYSTELRKSPSERNLSTVDRIWQRIVGKSIGGMSFSKVFAFDNGRAMVRRTDASKKNYFGFVDGQGNVVVPLEYTSLRNDGRESVYSKISGRFSKQGYIKAQKSVNGKSLYGIIDRNGNVVIDFAYTKMKYEHNQGDFALVCKNNLWGAIKMNGTSLAECKYKDIWFYTLSTDNNIRYIACEMPDGKYGIINMEGKTVVPFQYLGLSEEKGMIVLGHWVNGIKYYATYNPKTWALVSDEPAK